MTITRSLLAGLAILGFGAVAATTVPAMAQSGAIGAMNSHWSDHHLLGDRNDRDLTWRTAHSAGPMSSDHFRSPDWATRGDQGSQDQGFTYSEPQEKDYDPPCHC